MLSTYGQSSSGTFLVSTSDDQSFCSWKLEWLGLFRPCLISTGHASLIVLAHACGWKCYLANRHLWTVMIRSVANTWFIHVNPKHSWSTQLSGSSGSKTVKLWKSGTMVMLRVTFGDISWVKYIGLHLRCRSQEVWEIANCPGLVDITIGHLLAGLVKRQDDQHNRIALRYQYNFLSLVKHVHAYGSHNKMEWLLLLGPCTNLYCCCLN